MGKITLFAAFKKKTKLWSNFKMFSILFTCNQSNFGSYVQNWIAEGN